MIGVDFGNTNSCVTYADERDELRRVPVATGNPPYDTVLATIVLDPDSDHPTIGMQAQQNYEARREGVYLRSFKPELDNQRLRERRLVWKTVYKGFDRIEQAEMWDRGQSLEWTHGRFTREQLVGAASLILTQLLEKWLIEDGASRDDDIWLGLPVRVSSCTRKRLICALEQVSSAPTARRCSTDLPTCCDESTSCSSRSLWRRPPLMIWRSTVARTCWCSITGAALLISP